MSYSLPPDIEIIRPEDIHRGAIQHALFDFDGTLSLIREGWQQVMVPMMVDLLLETRNHESREEIARIVREFVDRLTGKQTIYQMIALQEQVRARGGEPLEALAYKHRYLDLLWDRISHRVAGLKAGTISREQMLVPGAVDILQGLCARGIVCYLASGTDIAYVRDEVDALGLTPYFAGSIYGALDDWENYSKAMVIQQIIKEHDLKGHQLVAFGDGFIEIENTVAVGGIAVGVASQEALRSGIDAWKRKRLIRAGAHIIIPDFCHAGALISYLCDQEESQES
jgi:phosphoglycolate phosphatase-like HAD superfamily hydrolase